MQNTELEHLLQKRSEAQTKLSEALKGLDGINPMSLMAGGFKSLGGIAAQFESVAHLNDLVITELARRALANG